MTQTVTQRVDPSELRRFIRDAMTRVGLPRADADTVARLMVAADLRGADGHGVVRLGPYLRRIQAGGINTRPHIRPVREAGAMAVVDGDNGMGHLVMSFAAQSAVSLAERHGVGWVGVRGSNHAGPGLLYAMMPLQSQMLGVYCAVGNANHMGPWGGTRKLLSTNPIAIAAPTGGDRPPIVLDMATSVVAYGAVKLRARRGEALPEGWMIDLDGRPIIDPDRADDGLLLPAGGHKGYGLSLMVTVLAGVLNGAAAGRHVVDFNHDDTTPTNTGHCIIAADIQKFQDVSQFMARVGELVDDLKASRTLPGHDEVRLPGERAHATYELRNAQGVPVSRDLHAELDGIARELDIDPVKIVSESGRQGVD